MVIKGSRRARFYPIAAGAAGFLTGAALEAWVLMLLLQLLHYQVAKGDGYPLSWYWCFAIAVVRAPIIWVILRVWDLGAGWLISAMARRLN